MLSFNLVVLGLLALVAAQITPVPPITTSAFPTSESLFSTEASDTSTDTDTGIPIGGSIFTTNDSTVTPTLPLSESSFSTDSLSTSDNITSTEDSSTSSDTSTANLTTTATSSAVASVTPSPTTSIPPPSATPPPSSAVMHAIQGSILWSAVIGLLLGTILY